MLTDGRRTTDAGVTGILIAHLGAFGSGELKTQRGLTMYYMGRSRQYTGFSETPDIRFMHIGEMT